MERLIVPPHRSRKGAALIVVMACLVLLVVLVMAFLLNSASELTMSKTHAEGGRASQLAQSAVGLAMAQIEEGARGVDSNGDPLAWASQPGMIRTFDVQGNPAGYHKLYSWTALSGTGAFVTAAPGEPLPADWSIQTAVFTDLNAPVESASGLVFPILDGKDLRNIGGSLTYDADDNGVPDIAGFSVKNAPVSAANPIPMPVKWIYVLADGRLVLPSSADGAKAVFSGAEAPTANNPIVGRMAFWTDDETCRININTASEGAYADAPRFGVLSADEKSLVENQPVTGEYQRYPGHPATTSLSTVLPGLTAEEIRELSPRVGTGGSQSGTVKTTMMAASPPIVQDPQRLFSSVDEMLFASETDQGERIPAHPKVDAAVVEKAKFFLTPFSRAPELNLLGRPRVSIWPVHANDAPAYRSAYDQMIAFCATMPGGGDGFAFLRGNPADHEQDLPVSGGTGLARNRTLLEYLRGLTSREIPGFGGRFSAKYSASDAAGMLPGSTIERDQILTQIFDYIRATNLVDVTVENPYAAGGQVVPIMDRNTGTRGFGRYRTVQGGNLLFIGTEALPADQLRIQAMFIPQFFDVAVGSVFNEASFRVRIEGLNAFRWDNGSGEKPMGFPSSILCDFPGSWWVDGMSYGDQMGIKQIADNTRFSDFISTTLDVVTTGDGFDFKGGDVTFTFLGAAGQELQQVIMRFPDGTFPGPELADDAFTAVDQGALKGPYNLRSFPGRKEAVRGIKEAWITNRDVIRSVSSLSGDLRLISVRQETPPPENAAYPFAPNVRYHTAHEVSGAHNLWAGDGQPYPFTMGVSGTPGGKLVRNAGYGSRVFPDVPLNGVAVGKKTSFAAGDVPGDWDTGIGELRDGPFINKPDEGDKGASGKHPYKWKSYTTQSASLNTTLFTPNRLVPSAVSFGSLPTGVLADRPWQTLLFRPGPAGHPGLGAPNAGRPPYTTPPDHLLLDLFWMPVVEPYAISEPFSTAGKVNLNHQIVPFSHITRNTGLRAVLASEQVIAVKTSDASNYKAHWTGSAPISGMTRRGIDVDETLAGFTRRFDAGDIFRSATEICGLDIVPDDYSGASPHTRSSMDSYWSARLLTGDNCRERPYATIYPRLTTQSNTFTIFYRAQALKKRAGPNPAVWDDESDSVTGEARGSETIERFIDPNTQNMPDFADLSESTPISSYYRFRTLDSRLFAP